ncbi:DUF1015 family protein [Actinorhabdospora filicis]|uniref:DUF1015 family protein n=1 Tax=Actinorhabdospora filicis TaxID=1785913 RepID=UPI002553730A|nr:DUF1015 family protein [Actinorhabdospora filicis]
MRAAHAISAAWLSTTGDTGAQNYDEFANDAEITDIIRANPASALAVEMPHLTPESLAAGLDFAQSLPMAAERLAAVRAAGKYTRHEDVVVVYRISDSTHTAYGLWAMVDTDQISTSADEPGLVIRNEDVFIEKVRQRAALTAQLGTLLSPVLLMQTGTGKELQDALAELSATLGEPSASDVDPQGRRHEIWPVAGPEAESLLVLASGGDLIVADGNHRSLAAQIGELPRFLAVITTPESVAIQPYHRLVRDMPLPFDMLLAALEGAGSAVTEVDGPAATPASGGTIRLYVAGRHVDVELPDADGTTVDRLDHAVVENLLFRAALDLDPGDKRITYVGGDYPPAWLQGEVDAGRADLAVLIPPVTVEDFIAVNLGRLKMPRKSTWFTPKARAGLVSAQLED